MNRRESIKAIGIGTVTTGLLLEAACKTDVKKLVPQDTTAATPADPSRKPNEIIRDNKLKAEKFFTDHEMATITVLVDIIIPKDEKSGSASDAKVPEFIEFIVNDMPDKQTPLRGGLRWLDMQCLQRYNNTFREATTQQQLEMVTDIAYPKKVKPGMEPGVSFFNRMRDLTASGFYTTEIGFKDIGFVGNTPNVWTGVPADVLKAHGFDTVWG
jgi:gluconate 2-dehydrogenase gamma chain